MAYGLKASSCYPLRQQSESLSLIGLGLPCLMQLLTWLHVSDYRSFFEYRKVVVFKKTKTKQNKTKQNKKKTEEFFHNKFTAKINFPIGYFMIYYIADADIGSP